MLLHRRVESDQQTAESMDNQIQTYTHPSTSVQENWTLGFKVTSHTYEQSDNSDRLVCSNLHLVSCSQSQASPRETMVDVLRVFHSLNIKWKRIGDYNMKCLWSPPLLNYSKPASCNAIKFETQLYRASAEFYVVDLQQLSGPPFLFLDICAAFRAQVV